MKKSTSTRRLQIDGQPLDYAPQREDAQCANKNCGRIIRPYYGITIGHNTFCHWGCYEQYHINQIRAAEGT